MWQKAIILFVTLGTQVWYNLSEPIGFFYLDPGNSTPRLNYYQKNSSVWEQRVLIYDGDVEEQVPDKVTICMSYFSSLDRGDVPEGWGSRREFPIWSIINNYTGGPNVVFYMKMSNSYDDRLDEKERFFGFVVSRMGGEYSRVAATCK